MQQQQPQQQEQQPQLPQPPQPPQQRPVSQAEEDGEDQLHCSHCGAGSKEWWLWQLGLRGTREEIAQQRCRRCGADSRLGRRSRPGSRLKASWRRHPLTKRGGTAKAATMQHKGISEESAAGRSRQPTAAMRSRPVPSHPCLSSTSPPRSKLQALQQPLTALPLQPDSVCVALSGTTPRAS